MLRRSLRRSGKWRNPNKREWIGAFGETECWESFRQIFELMFKYFFLVTASGGARELWYIALESSWLARVVELLWPDSPYSWIYRCAAIGRDSLLWSLEKFREFSWKNSSRLLSGQLHIKKGWWTERRTVGELCVVGTWTSSTTPHCVIITSCFLLYVYWIFDRGKTWLGVDCSFITIHFY